jgi:peroxiredoxin
MFLRKNHILAIKALLIVILFLSQETLKSQNGYTIELNISGKTDSTFILANFFGDKFHIVDSSSKKNNTIEFSGQKELSGGVYIILNSKKEKLLECLIDKDQTFTIVSDSTFAPSQTSTINNAENILFNKHLIYTNHTYEMIIDARKQIENQKNNQVVLDSMNQKITSLISALIDYRKSEISSHSGTFYSALLKAMLDVEIPDAIKQQPDLAYIYMRNHFWDNYDLSDSRLLRTPLLPGKIETYLDKLTPPVPDSVIHSVEKMILLTKENKEVRDYLIWQFTSKYQNPKIMGLDKVFVYLADNYFSKFEIANTTPTIKAKIIEKSDQIRKLLIGVKSPDLWLTDTTGTYRSFTEIKADYTVLFFWDQECSICKKDLNELKKLYATKKFNLEVYAICANEDLEGWKYFIKANQLSWLNVNGTKSITPDFHDLYDIYTTPVIYILDKEKKIIAKRINVNQIPQVIQMNDSQ